MRVDGSDASSVAAAAGSLRAMGTTADAMEYFLTWERERLQSAIAAVTHLEQSAPHCAQGSSVAHQLQTIAATNLAEM